MVVPASQSIHTNGDKCHPRFHESTGKQHILAERIATVTISYRIRFRFDIKGVSCRISGHHLKRLMREIVHRVGDPRVIDRLSRGVKITQQLSAIRKPIIRQAFEQRQVGNFKVSSIRTADGFESVVALPEPGGRSISHIARNRNKRGKTFTVRTTQSSRYRSETRHFILTVLSIRKVVACLREMTARTV